MTKMISIAFVLALAACSKSSGGGAGGDPCAEPIGKAIDSMMAGSKAPPEAMEQMKTISDKLRAVMVSTCQADKWSAEVLACFGAAKGQPEIKKCRAQLPAEQAQHLQSEILKVMSGGTGGMAPHMGPHGGGMAPPPPAAGSAAPEGSAAPAGSTAPAGSAAP